MRKWLGRVVRTVLTMAVPLSAMAGPIGVPTITPSSAPVGVPVTVTVTAVITDPTVIPGSVNLEQLDSSGNTVSVLGTLHDDGKNCDPVAGDHKYSICATIIPSSTGPLHLRVSASQTGTATREHSGSATLDCKPPQPLTISSKPVLTGVVGTPYRYQVVVTDPDGAALTYALTARPNGMLIGAKSGLVSWTPSAIGTYSVALNVSDGREDDDGRENQATQSYKLTISAPAKVAVPNVVGLTQSAAGAALTTATLKTGTVTQASSATVPAGEVISENPTAGTLVAPGSAVALSVSTGPATVAVPNVVGLTQSAAGTALTAATLTTGAVTQATSATVPAGTVISQNPLAATLVAPATAVALVVSSGPPPVAVPNVVGLTQAAAGTALTTATLTTGAVTQATSATIPAGSVISQSPVAGTLVPPGTGVALVVSSGPPPVAVPNVVGLTQSAAGTALTAATLTTGAVTQATSTTVPAGSVISQNPIAGTLVPPGTGVALVVSSGPPPVAVPNVVGLTQAAAGTALTAATLTTGAVTQATSATVPAGSVISQNPIAGTLVPPGTGVALVVSSGPPPVAVPNVVGLTQAAAGTALTAATLTTGAVTQATSATVPAGSVISQSPVAATLVPPGTAVALVVSTGPALVPVPNVIGLTQSAAGTALTTATLTTGTMTQAASATVAAGSVISQNPVAATLVPPGTAVTLVVSSGPAPVPVPNVVGLDQSSAGSAVAAATLTTGAVTQAASATVPAGSVISQNPVAATLVAPGTAVALVVSTGPALVPVPNVIGLTQSAAGTALTAVTLTTGTVTQATSAAVAAGNVISQSPVAATLVAPGTAVALVVSSGPAQVSVPDVIGLTQSAAGASLTTATLTTGVVTLATSPTVPAGDVIGQDPAPLAQVNAGTAVSLVISSGPAVTALNLTLSLNPPVTPTFAASQLIQGAVGASTPVVPPLNPASALLTITSGLQGQTLSVGITGVNTIFSPGATQISFGTAIAVNSVTVQSATQASANITIPASAPPGPLVVTVSTGAQQLVLGNLFNVATGQGAVTGSLVDSAGNAIAGAQVCTSDALLCTTTDSKGNFALNNVSASVGALAISATGYVSLSAPIAVNVATTVPVGVIALASSGLLPPPTVPPGTPQVAPALASAIGRGASQLRPGSDLPTLQKLIQDSLVATGGTEGGVIDANGNQLNPNITGNGAISLNDGGVQNMAEAMASGSTTTLGDLLGRYFRAFNYGTQPVPSMLSVLSGLQTEVNAAWADPTRVDAPLLMVLFNQGYSVSIKPPQLALDTPMNELQSYLALSSLLTYTANQGTLTATGPQAQWTQLAALEASLQLTMTDASAPMILAQATTPPPTTGQTVTAALSTAWSTVMSQVAPKFNLNLQTGAVTLSSGNAGVELVRSLYTSSNTAMRNASVSFGKYFLSQGATATTAQTLQQTFANQGFQAGWQSAQAQASRQAITTGLIGFASTWVQGQLSAVQGKVIDAIFKMQVDMIISSLQPQAPLITSVQQLIDPSTGLPSNLVQINFQRSANDKGTQAASNETWWYQVFRQHGGTVSLVATGRPGPNGPGPITTSTNTNLLFYDFAPQGTDVYRIQARRLIGTLPEAAGYTNLDALMQTVSGLFSLPTSTPGGIALPINPAFLQQILDPAAQILNGIKYQISPLSDPGIVFVNTQPAAAQPPAEMAVDRDRGLVYLSVGATGAIATYQNGQVVNTTNTNFAAPFQSGLTIDGQGSLYCDNSASDATFGGRIFAFTPAGQRTFVGSATYYSMMLQYAQGVSVQSLAIGPGPQGESLYVADQVSGGIGRIFPTYLPAGFDRNVAQPFVNSSLFWGANPPLMAFRGDGTLFVAQGPNIYLVSADGSRVQSLFDPTSAPSPFTNVSGMAFDNDVNLYVSDLNSGSITKIPLIYQTPSLGLAGLSPVALSKLVVAQGYLEPARIQLSPDGRGLVFYDVNRPYYFVPFGLTGQVTDSTGAPVPNANVLVADRSIDVVTDGNGVYVMPGLLAFGESNVVNVTISAGGQVETFQTILDPNQQNQQDFVFSPAPLAPSTQTATPTVSNPVPGTPIAVHALTGTTTVVDTQVTVPKLLVPGVSPPPPPAGPTSTCKLRGLLLAPADGLALSANTVSASGFVTDPGIAANALTLLVNGVSYPAPLVGGHFSVAGVLLGEGNNSVVLAVSSTVLQQEGCLPAGVPAGTNLIPISRISHVFYDPSATTVAGVASARGFDTAISGHLVDSDTHLPVVGLTVQAQGVAATAVTDMDGVFELKLQNAALPGTGTTVQSVPDTGLSLNVTQQ
jgi:beta-lactam-binding protein with PASTA domain